MYYYSFLRAATVKTVKLVQIFYYIKLPEEAEIKLNACGNNYESVPQYHISDQRLDTFVVIK